MFPYIMFDGHNSNSSPCYTLKLLVVVCMLHQSRISTLKAHSISGAYNSMI